MCAYPDLHPNPEHESLVLNYFSSFLHLPYVKITLCHIKIWTEKVYMRICVGRFCVCARAHLCYFKSLAQKVDLKEGFKTFHDKKQSLFLAEHLQPATQHW